MFKGKNTGMKAKAALLATAICAAAPAQAFATGTATSTLLSDVSGLFDNMSLFAVVVYEGFVGLAFVIALISICKELLPAILNANKEERAQFKGRITAAITAVVVLIALALAPVLVPAAVSFFGGTADIGISAVTGI